MSILSKFMKKIHKIMIQKIIEKKYRGVVTQDRVGSCFIYQINDTVYYQGYRFIDMSTDPFTFLLDNEYLIADFLKEL